MGTRPPPADAVAAGTMVTVGPASGGTDDPFKTGREAAAARAQARAARVEEEVRASALAMEGESVAPVSEGNLVDAGIAGTPTSSTMPAGEVTAQVSVPTAEGQRGNMHDAGPRTMAAAGAATAPGSKVSSRPATPTADRSDAESDAPAQKPAGATTRTNGKVKTGSKSATGGAKPVK